MSIDWLDLLYLLGIPLLQQLLKLLTEEFGLVLDKWMNQALCVALAIVAGLLSGDFLGIAWAAWSGDLMAFIGGNLDALVAAWAVVSLEYEVIWDRLYKLGTKVTPLRLVTKDKLPG